jgi:hypothetical protein
MKTVFLSHNFAENRDLIAAVEALIESVGLWPRLGDVLGGDVVPEAVKELIEHSDACVALATPRAQVAGGTWVTHPWVHDELLIARTVGIPAIALVDRQVKLEGALAPYEHIDYDPMNPLPAMAKLARTLALWKGPGRQLKVLVLPSAVAQAVARDPDRVSCRYRYYGPRGTKTAWQEAMVVPREGGPVIHLEGAQDDHFVEVKLTVGRSCWTTPAVAPFAHVTFRKGAA